MILDINTQFIVTIMVMGLLGLLLIAEPGCKIAGCGRFAWWGVAYPHRRHVGVVSARATRFRIYCPSKSTADRARGSSILCGESEGQRSSGDSRNRPRAGMAAGRTGAEPCMGAHRARDHQSRDELDDRTGSQRIGPAQQSESINYFTTMLRPMSLGRAQQIRIWSG